MGTPPVHIEGLGHGGDRGSGHRQRLSPHDAAPAQGGSTLTKRKRPHQAFLPRRVISRIPSTGSTPGCTRGLHVYPVAAGEARRAFLSCFRMVYHLVIVSHSAAAKRHSPPNRQAAGAVGSDPKLSQVVMTTVGAIVVDPATQSGITLPGSCRGRSACPT